MQAVVTWEEKLVNEAATQEAAGRLARQLVPGLLIFLHGELGAGKTTFARGILHSLGYAGKVKSPTYTLVEPYDLPLFTLFHFDLYRLLHPDELFHLGIEEYVSPYSVCLVEWPEKARSVLPPADLNIYLLRLETAHHLRVVSHSEKGEAILQKVLATPSMKGS